MSDSLFQLLEFLCAAQRHGEHGIGDYTAQQNFQQGLHRLRARHKGKGQLTACGGKEQNQQVLGVGFPVVPHLLLETVFVHHIGGAPQVCGSTGHQSRRQNTEQPPKLAPQDGQDNVDNARKDLNKSAVTEQTHGVLVGSDDVSHAGGIEIQRHDQWDLIG